MASMNSRWKIRDSRSPEVIAAANEIKNKVVEACRLYHIMINTFIQLRLDILTGMKLIDTQNEQFKANRMFSK